MLTDGPLSAAELSSRLPLPADATVLLLDAAVSLQLLQRRSDGRYGLGRWARRLLGNPGVVAMVEHHAMLYADLQRSRRAAARRRRGRPARGLLALCAAIAAAADLSREAIAPYTALMAASQPLIAQRGARRLSVPRHRCLLDIGGGDGAFIAAVAARTPDSCAACCSICPRSPTRRANGFAAVGLSRRARWRSAAVS